MHTSSPPVCHENLECLLSAGRADLLHAVSAQAVALPMFQASLPAGRLILFHPGRKFRPFLNDDAVLRHSDLGPRLIRAGAVGFLPSYRSSRFLERWGQEAGLHILSPRHSLQRALEDKLRFDQLLTRHAIPAPEGGTLSSADQIGRLPAFPLVCQVPSSEGMEGTLLVPSRRQLLALLRAQKLKLPLLCRRFVQGVVLGMTIVVGERELILSAARHQCRRLRHREVDLAGVQWARSDSFSATQRDNMARVMSALGDALRQAGLRGTVNVDFILAGDDVLLIECNPRFSSSTPQLSGTPSLLHGLDFVAEHLRAVRGRPLSAHRPTLPRSTFEGAYVDFSEWAMSVMRSAHRRIVAAMPGVGVHEMVRDLLRFRSPDVAELQGDQRLLFHYSSPPDTPLGPRTDHGSLFTCFPIFSFRAGRSALTRRGQTLMRLLSGEVHFSRPHQTLADLAEAGGGALWRDGPERPPAEPGG